MKSSEIHYQTILIAAALLVIPIGVVAVLYPILPVIQVPRSKQPVTEWTAA